MRINGKRWTSPDVVEQREFMDRQQANSVETKQRRQQREREARATALIIRAFFDKPLGIADIDRHAVRERVLNSGQRSWRQRGLSG